MAVLQQLLMPLAHEVHVLYCFVLEQNLFVFSAVYCYFQHKLSHVTGKESA